MRRRRGLGRHEASNAGVYPKTLDYTKAYTLKFVGG